MVLRARITVSTADEQGQNKKSQVGHRPRRGQPRAAQGPDVGWAPARLVSSLNA